MGSYITYANFALLTGTTLPEATCNLFIARAEAEVTAFCTKNNLTATTTNDNLINAAYMLACWYLRLRERIDGTKPNSFSLGGWSFSDNNDTAMKQLRDAAAESLAIYQATSDSPWSDSDAGTTIVRADHRMKRMKLDHETDYEYHDEAADYGTDDDPD